MTYQIWCEGYPGTPAQKLAEVSGATFKTACGAYFAGRPDKKEYDSAKLTWYGRALFDNAADARVLFG